MPQLPIRPERSRRRKSANGPATFEKDEHVEGLYLRKDRAKCYYSRATINGRRTWKSLETTDRSVALLRHREQQLATEKARQSGVDLASAYQTLGACAQEYRRRIADSTLAESSRTAYLTNLRRLEKHWPQGVFEATRVRSITRDVIFRARTALQKARVAKGRKGCVAAERHYVGYSNTAINDTLDALRRLLGIAIEKRALIENPFSQGGVLQDKLHLPKKTRRPEIPDRPTLDRVLAEIRRGGAATLFPSKLRWVAHQQEFASNAADFAEFLAYSGARWNEANEVLVKYYTPACGDRPASLYIPGYKTISSERTIPVIPPLRRLLDRLVAGRQPSEKLLRTTGCLYPLKKACLRLAMPTLTQHDLRHYFATICLEKTQNVKAVSEWLGHKDGGKLVLETYAHLLRNTSYSLAQLVDWADAPKPVPAAIA